MLILPFIAVLAAIAFSIGWVIGEAGDNRVLRRSCAIGALVVYSGIAAALAGLSASLGVGVPYSHAVNEFVTATAEQLDAGRVDQVKEQLHSFEVYAPTGYESGKFLNGIHQETEKMQSIK